MTHTLTQGSIPKALLAFSTPMILGNLLQQLYCAAALPSIGNTSAPLVFLGVAAVTNILLDLLFVMGFGWSVEGAAWATVASQALSAALILVYFLHKAKGLIPKRRHCRIDKRLLGSIVTSSTLTAVQ